MIVTWKRPCRRCGNEYTTWEVRPDDEEVKFGMTGDATGLCPACQDEENGGET